MKKVWFGLAVFIGCGFVFNASAEERGLYSLIYRTKAHIERIYEDSTLRLILSDSAEDGTAEGYSAQEANTEPDVEETPETMPVAGIEKIIENQSPNKKENER